MRKGLRRLRPHLGSVLVLASGAWLLIFGALFAVPWMGYLASGPSQTWTNPDCPPCAHSFFLNFTPPDPYPIFLSYAFATPLILALGGWIRRQSAQPGLPARVTRVRRIASWMLIAAMGGMAVFLAAGFIAGEQALSLPAWARDTLRDAFLGALFAVPIVVLGAGTLNLVTTRQSSIRGTPPAARG